MRFNNGIVLSVVFPDAFSEVIDQFLQCFVLRSGWLFPIEISDQTNTEGDIIQVITVHMPAVDLPGPATSHLDFAISGGTSVPDHKMIRQTISHLSCIAMVEIKNLRIPLGRPAVMHDNVTPAVPFHRSTVDGLEYRPGKIFVSRAPKSKPTFLPTLRWRFQTTLFFQTRLLDSNRCR